MRRQDRASNLWEQQPSVETPKYHGHKQVYGLEMGVGREAMSVMCDIFNTPRPPPPPPPCHHNACDQHVAALYVAHKKAAAKQLQKARNKVFSLHRSDKTDVAEILR
jgi:hypothetical protein